MAVKVQLFIMFLFITGFFIVFFSNKSYLLETKPNPKLCTCDKCFSEKDPWFVKRFNKSVDLFLTGDNYLSKEDFNWWRKLQYERRSYTFFLETALKLFEMFSLDPPVTSPSPDNCRLCAVVGNSGTLNGSRYGELIDLHNIVIRINSGQTEGYEEDVGSITTHRVMYPESAVDLDNSTHLVLVPFKIADLQWLMGAFTTGFKGPRHNKLKITANKDLVMVVNPVFIKYVHQSWLKKKGLYPSTGFMTLVLALHICDEVSVFGFGADKDGNWSHYWEKLRNKKLKTGNHPGSLEYNMILELAKLGKITFYSGK